MWELQCVFVNIYTCFPLQLVCFATFCGSDQGHSHFLQPWPFIYYLQKWPFLLGCFWFQFTFWLPECLVHSINWYSLNLTGNQSCNFSMWGNHLAYEATQGCSDHLMLLLSTERLWQTDHHRLLFTQLTVQSMGLHHPWPLMRKLVSVLEVRIKPGDLNQRVRDVWLHSLSLYQLYHKLEFFLMK